MITRITKHFILAGLLFSTSAPLTCYGDCCDVIEHHERTEADDINDVQKLIKIIRANEHDDVIDLFSKTIELRTTETIAPINTILAVQVPTEFGSVSLAEYAQKAKKRNIANLFQLTRFATLLAAIKNDDTDKKIKAQQQLTTLINQPDFQNVITIKLNGTLNKDSVITIITGTVTLALLDIALATKNDNVIEQLLKQGAPLDAKSSINTVITCPGSADCTFGFNFHGSWKLALDILNNEIYNNKELTQRYQADADDESYWSRKALEASLRQNQTNIAALRLIVNMIKEHAQAQGKHEIAKKITQFNNTVTEPQWIKLPAPEMCDGCCD